MTQTLLHHQSIEYTSEVNNVVVKVWHRNKLLDRGAQSTIRQNVEHDPSGVAAEGDWQQ